MIFKLNALLAITVSLTLVFSPTAQARDQDLNLGLSYRDVCSESSDCRNGFRLGLEYRFWQSGKRAEGYDIMGNALPGENLVRLSSSASVPGLVTGLLVAIAVFVFAWVISVVVVTLVSGRVAFGGFLDLEQQNLEGGSLLAGNLGFSMTSYIFNDLDFGISFSLAARTARLLDIDEDRTFNGLTGKVGIGYIPDVSKSGFFVKYERESHWNRAQQLVEDNLSQKTKVFPVNEYSQTFTAGWSQAL